MTNFKDFDINRYAHMFSLNFYHKNETSFQNNEDLEKISFQDTLGAP